jgi:hypothetical protein
MSQVNRGRVIIGGIAGGIVIFLLMGLANHLFLDAEWKRWSATYGSILGHPSARGSMMLWLVQSLAFGITGAAIYAGIRSRYGAGSGTAIRAGFLLWVAGSVTAMLNGLAVGDLPRQIVVGECVAGLASLLIGTYVAAWIYKE